MDDPQIRFEAQAALQTIRTRGAGLTSSPSETADEARRLAQQIRDPAPVVTVSPSGPRRGPTFVDEPARHAFDDLNAMGYDARAAMSILTEILNTGDKTQAWQASTVMVKTVFPAIPSLTTALAATRPATRKQALDALQQMGRYLTGTKAAARVIPAAVACLADDDAAVRLAAAKFLDTLGDDSPRVADAMQKALHDASDEVRQVAVVWLLRRGVAVDEAVAVLNAAALADSPNVDSGVLLLGKVGPKAKPAVSGLIHLAVPRASRDPFTRGYAIAALGLIGPEAKEAVATLTQEAQRQAPPNRPSQFPGQPAGDPFAATRGAAVYALAKVAGNDAIPVLMQALQDEQNSVRIAAADALWRLDHSRAAAPSLSRVILRASPGTTDAADGLAKAVRLLGKIGPDARRAAPLIAQAIDEPEHSGPLERYQYLEIACAEALWQIQKDPLAIATLSRIARVPGTGIPSPWLQEVREPWKEALRAWIRLGPEAPAVLPLMAELYHRGNAHTRAGLATIALEMNQPDRALKIIRIQMADLDPMARVEMIDALAAEGPAAKSAVPELVAAVKDEYPRVRRDAYQALLAVDAQAAEQLSGE